MQLINIFSIHNTEYIFEQSMNMALTHLVEKYDAYAKAFKHCDSYKILDNSIVELGKALPLERILEAANKIDADEIIIPDVFNNATKTLNSVEKVLSTNIQNDFPNLKLMAVCQGATDAEFEMCFNELCKLPIDVIGIPKLISNRHTEGRPYYEYLWQDIGGAKQIHLLGLASSVSELFEYKQPHKIRSCDSGLLPFMYSLGLNILKNRPMDIKINLETDYMLPIEHWIMKEDLNALRLN